MDALEKYQQITEEHSRVNRESTFLGQTIDGRVISSPSDTPRRDLPEFQERYQKYVQDLTALKKSIPQVFQALDSGEYYEEAEEMRTLTHCLAIRQKEETGELEFVALKS